ncbi:MAG: FlgD immunoglobulin-like domain containing protein [Alphaproteobacteria bacterium]
MPNTAAVNNAAFMKEEVKPGKGKEIFKSGHDNFIEMMQMYIKANEVVDPTNHEFKPMEMVTAINQMMVAQGISSMEEETRKTRELHEIGHMLNASKMVGQIVETKGSKFNFNDKFKTSVTYELPKEVSYMQVNILNDKGEIVHTSRVNPKLGTSFLPVGKGSYKWDGTLDDDFRRRHGISEGTVAENGKYRVGFTLFDKDNKVLQNPKTRMPYLIDTTVTDVVTGSMLDDKKAHVRMNDRMMPLESMVGIHDIDKYKRISALETARETAESIADAVM